MAFTDLTIAEKLTQIGQDLAALKEQANTTTGGTDNTLKEAVETLIAGYGQGGGSGLFDELSELGYDAETIAELNAIKEEDIAYSKAKATFASQSQDANLRYAKYFDTSTLVNPQLYNCNSLDTIPIYDFSSATSLNFAENQAIQRIKVKISSKLTSILGSFQSCRSLKEVILVGDTSNITSCYFTFASCSTMVSAPEIDTSSCTSFRQMFQLCTSLTTLPAYDMSSATDVQNMFNGVSSLVNLGGFPGLSIDFSVLQWNSKLTHDSLMNVINGLATVTTSPTLTLGSTNLAKLTESELQIAIDKGWTLA